jgi:hypothetical protein
LRILAECGPRPAQADLRVLAEGRVGYTAGASPIPGSGMGMGKGRGGMRALAKLHEPDASIQRYRAPDTLIDFLRSL